MEEYFDVLDEEGMPSGITKPKSEVHTKGYWHRTVHIWIINENNEILLQRRSNTKKRNPNILTISCEGHVSAGESSIQGAIRELDEELGLKVKNDDLKYIKSIKRAENRATNYYNNEFKDFYILRTNVKVEDIIYQKEEISEVMYVTWETLKEIIHTNEVIIREYSYEILKDFFKNKS